MTYVFNYNDTQYTSKSLVEMEQFVFEWIDNNSEAFFEYGNNKHGYISEDNYEAVVESFFEDTVTEEEPLLANLRS
jgi:hypothetical protein